MSESVSSIGGSDRRNGIFKSFDEVVNGIRSELTDTGFKLGEEVFYRIEVWRVGGEVKQLAISSLYKLTDSLVVVNSKVIHDDDLSWAERRA